MERVRGIAFTEDDRIFSELLDRCHVGQLAEE